MNNNDMVEQRNDTWMITDEYLTLAAHLVANQFIEDEDTPTYPSYDVFAERATYVMRHHAPIAYAYFFEATQGQHILPGGTIDIIFQIISRARPLFSVGGLSLDPGINSPTTLN